MPFTRKLNVVLPAIVLRQIFDLAGLLAWAFADNLPVPAQPGQW